MELRGEITEQDYLRAQWLFMKPRRMFRVVGYVLLALYGLATIVTVGTSLALDRPHLATALLLLPVAFPLLACLQRYTLVRMYRRQPALGGTHTYTLQPDRITFSSQHATGEARWSVYTKWREDGHLFLIYQGENIYTLLPKRWLAQASRSVEEVKALLSERVGQSID